MKNILTLLIVVIYSVATSAQSDGISYQAVIIDKSPLEIPGMDVSGNYLAETEVTLRFTIEDAGQNIEYQESQLTTTDPFGLINVIIGQGVIGDESPGSFNEISWDGEAKFLIVDLAYGGSELEELSRQNLLFVPYAYHRNITATGTLTVDMETLLNSDLTVGEDALIEGNTVLEGNLTVNGDSVNVSNDLFVQGNSILDENLTVHGDSVNISNDLFVEGNTSLEGTLDLTMDSDEFVATFTNNSAGEENGDGIKIKLGKIFTKNNDLARNADVVTKLAFCPEVPLAPFVELFSEDPDFDFLLEMQIPTDPQEILDYGLAIAATACILTETIINTTIDLTFNQILPLEFPEFCVDVGFDDICIGGFELIPAIPDINFPCDFFGPPLELPSLTLDDVWSTNPLTSENVFIEFADSSDYRMGAIKAQSIEEWALGYLDAVYLYGLVSTFRGLDKGKLIPEMKKQASEIAKAYLKIGVEYSSGNGDYAEWLIRMDSREAIAAGDIVAVKGGMITKDLREAEQVMAISHAPIVLGNIPNEGEKHLGNNVAFMGQIPVKVMGAVATGDYIVGNKEVPGYGIAINPQDMTIEDLDYAVGRAWEASSELGPKMVNTVVGVHNGDYVNILKKYEQKFKDSEKRLQSLEAAVETLSGYLPGVQLTD